ncbi:MAG TPA: HAMP domain-containing sensor histidine kinase [Polyangiaceae bacterium]
MVAVVGAVAAIAYWDEERESAAALGEFAREQTTLARSLTSALGARLDEARRESPRDAGVFVTLVRADMARVEIPGTLVVLLRVPGERSLRATDGRIIEAPEVVRAMNEGRTWLRVPPSDAPAVGLPPRTALGGVAELDGGSLGKWGVAAIATAAHARDRERRARWRLILAVVGAGGIVLLFGGGAWRLQRRELELERELAIADLGRRRDEQLSQTTRAATLGTLAMGIAHEISTPLGIITGRAEQLLARIGQEEKNTQAVKGILEQTNRIDGVVRAFLGLARGEAPASEELAPAGIVNRAMALCEHRFARAGIRLDASIPSDLPRIRGDQRLLEQALVNLLLNACDACERDGHVSVLVENGAWLSFCVVDDGVGIAVDVARRAIEPFFTTKPSGAGTGLGLAIVNEIAKHHRGTLEVSPHAPRGTIARLTIPTATEQAG